MVAEPKMWFLTPEEYLRQECAAETKSEFIGGEIIAMAGASLTHIRITDNVTIKLGNQLEGKSCEVFSQDLRVKMNEEGDYGYPDVVVACDAEVEGGDNLTNPVVIIEVLSPSTELKDRTTKFEAFRKRDSLLDYVLIAQNRVHVEHFHRGSNKSWILTMLDVREDELVLDSIGCRVKLSEIYARVHLPDLRPVPQKTVEAEADSNSDAKSTIATGEFS